MSQFIQRVSLVVCFVLVVSTHSFSQKNPRATAKLEQDGKFVMIEYGRPSLKGRDMLEMAEIGKVWRMGADKSTTLTSDSTITFGKVSIPQGSYSLWLKKLAENSFELVFNKATGQWGTQHEAIQDFASVPMVLSEGTESVEVFTIRLGKASKGGSVELLWGKTILRAHFALK